MSCSMQKALSKGGGKLSAMAQEHFCEGECLAGVGGIGWKSNFADKKKRENSNRGAVGKTHQWLKPRDCGWGGFKGKGKERYTPLLNYRREGHMRAEGTYRAAVGTYRKKQKVFSEKRNRGHIGYDGTWEG